MSKRARAYFDDNEMRAFAQMLSTQGRFGDSELVHVNPEELKLLKRLSGGGTVNPETGLYEFWAGSDAAEAANDGLDGNGGDFDGGVSDSGLGGSDFGDGLGGAEFTGGPSGYSESPGFDSSSYDAATGTYSDLDGMSAADWGEISDIGDLGNSIAETGIGTGSINGTNADNISDLGLGEISGINGADLGSFDGGNYSNDFSVDWSGPGVSAITETKSDLDVQASLDFMRSVADMEAQKLGKGRREYGTPDLTAEDRANLVQTLAGELGFYNNRDINTPEFWSDAYSILGTIDARRNMDRRGRVKGIDGYTSYTDVVKDRAQYSTWNNDAMRSVAKANVAKHGDVLGAIVDNYFSGRAQTSMPSADHYHATYVDPDWGDQFTAVGKQGTGLNTHTFYESGSFYGNPMSEEEMARSTRSSNMTTDVDYEHIADAMANVNAAQNTQFAGINGQVPSPASNPARATATAYTAPGQMSPAANAAAALAAGAVPAPAPNPTRTASVPTPTAKPGTGRFAETFAAIDAMPAAPNVSITPAARQNAINAEQMAADVRASLSPADVEVAKAAVEQGVANPETAAAVTAEVAKNDPVAAGRISQAFEVAQANPTPANKAAVEAEITSAMAASKAPEGRISQAFEAVDAEPNATNPTTDFGVPVDGIGAAPDEMAEIDDIDRPGSAFGNTQAQRAAVSAQAREDLAKQGMYFGAEANTLGALDANTLTQQEADNFLEAMQSYKEKTNPQTLAGKGKRAIGTQVFGVDAANPNFDPNFNPANQAVPNNQMNVVRAGTNAALPTGVNTLANVVFDKLGIEYNINLGAPMSREELDAYMSRDRADWETGKSDAPILGPDVNDADTGPADEADEVEEEAEAEAEVEATYFEILGGSDRTYELGHAGFQNYDLTTEPPTDNELKDVSSGKAYTTTQRAKQIVENTLASAKTPVKGKVTINYGPGGRLLVRIGGDTLQFDSSASGLTQLQKTITDVTQYATANNVDLKSGIYEDYLSAKEFGDYRDPDLNREAENLKAEYQSYFLLGNIDEANNRASKLARLTRERTRRINLRARSGRLPGLHEIH